MTTNVLFDANRAHTGGKFITTEQMIQAPNRCMWIFDIMMTTAAAMGDPNNIWGINDAPYGNKAAAQAAKLVGPSFYEVINYGSNLIPPLSFQLMRRSCYDS